MEEEGEGPGDKTPLLYQVILFFFFFSWFRVAYFLRPIITPLITEMEVVMEYFIQKKITKYVKLSEIETPQKLGTTNAFNMER